MDSSIVFARWRQCASQLVVLHCTQRVHIPNGISIGSAVFAGPTIVTARQTDRPRYSICRPNNRLHLRSTAMQPNNNNDWLIKRRCTAIGILAGYCTN